MTPQEAATVLAVAAAYDGRHTPASEPDAVVKARAWAAALDADMEPGWAQGHVTRHYAEETRTLMPSDINRAWRDHVKRERESARQRRAIEDRHRQQLEAVPMPDFVREAIRGMVHRESTLETGGDNGAGK